MGGQKEWGSKTHSLGGILILKTKEEIKTNRNHLLYYKEPKHLGKKWTSTVDCGLLKPMNKNVRAYLKMRQLLQKWFHKILPASLPATMWRLLPCSPPELLVLGDDSTGQFWSIAWIILLGNHVLAVWFARITPATFQDSCISMDFSLPCFVLFFKQRFCWNTAFSNPSGKIYWLILCCFVLTGRIAWPGGILRPWLFPSYCETIFYPSISQPSCSLGGKRFHPLMAFSLVGHF